ncbi:MAG: MotA/TolQ/ExbB proton channel family protein [Gammaproteobacteria bacterium]|nr:MotA/TolQ/ExbB proton channel family protein [Gammaproteobacteria bacterium]
MLEQLTSGGWVMVPLVFFSILALAICVNRFWELTIWRVLPPQLQDDLATDPLEINFEYEPDSSSLAFIASAVIARREAGIEMAIAALDDALMSETHRLERYLTSLGTIASVAPLLGLLGTVLGMIDVFQALNQHGARDPAAFSGGIGEALITTAVGLCVAIPSLFCHRHFQRRVDEFAQQLEQEGNLLIGELFPPET